MQRGGDIGRRFQSLSPDERRLLAVLGFTFLVNQYDMALLGLALPQIQSDLAVSEAALGPMLSAVKLGALLAVPMALAADRVGRRRLLLLTIAGFTGCTLATAFAATPGQLIAFQFAGRACIAAEEVIAIVVVAEELSARARGLGFGLLAIFGAVGHGVAAIAYGFVETLPFGWRALYGVGLIPLLTLAWIRRGLRESRRFEAARAANPAAGPVLAPLLSLFRAHPGRLTALLAATGAFGFATAALAFVSKTLQHEHGWTPADVTLLIVGAGTLTLAAYPTAGVLSDRFGRGHILACALVIYLAGALAFYQSSGALLVAAWIAMMAGFMASDVLFGALGAELFATTQRATASAVRMLALSGGGAAGLALEGWLYSLLGSHTQALVAMLAAGLLAPLIVWWAIPETAARELESIAPDPGATGEAT